MFIFYLLVVIREFMHALSTILFSYISFISRADGSSIFYTPFIPMNSIHVRTLISHHDRDISSSQD